MAALRPRVEGSGDAGRLVSMGIAARSRYWRDASLLGVATVGAYGVVNYAFGVLIDPLHEDTGWSTGTLSFAYSAGVLLSGAVAFVAGRTLDRHGSRPVLLTALAGPFHLQRLKQEITKK